MGLNDILNSVLACRENFCSVFHCDFRRLCAWLLRQVSHGHDSVTNLFRANIECKFFAAWFSVRCNFFCRSGSCKVSFSCNLDGRRFVWLHRTICTSIVIYICIYVVGICNGIICTFCQSNCLFLGFPANPLMISVFDRDGMLYLLSCIIAWLFGDNNFHILLVQRAFCDGEGRCDRAFFISVRVLQCLVRRKHYQCCLASFLVILVMYFVEAIVNWCRKRCILGGIQLDFWLYCLLFAKIIYCVGRFYHLFICGKFIGCHIHHLYRFLVKGFSRIRHDIKEDFPCALELAAFCCQCQFCFGGICAERFIVIVCYAVICRGQFISHVGQDERWLDCLASMELVFNRAFAVCAVYLNQISSFCIFCI